MDFAPPCQKAVRGGFPGQPVSVLVRQGLRVASQGFLDALGELLGIGVREAVGEGGEEGVGGVLGDDDVC